MTRLKRKAWDYQTNFKCLIIFFLDDLNCSILPFFPPSFLLFLSQCAILWNIGLGYLEIAHMLFLSGNNQDVWKACICHSGRFNKSICLFYHGWLIYWRRKISPKHARYPCLPVSPCCVLLYPFCCYGFFLLLALKICQITQNLRCVFLHSF